MLRLHALQGQRITSRVADLLFVSRHCPCCRAKYPGCKVECGPALDLMNQASVKAFAQAILKRPGGLHILVNNAGLGYCKKSFTEDGVGMLTQVSVFCNCATPHSSPSNHTTPAKVKCRQ